MLLAEFPAVEAAACPALPPAWRSLEDLPPAWRSLEDLPPAAGWRTQTGWMFGGLFPSPGFTLLAGQLENIHLTCDTFVLVTLWAFDNRGLNTEHTSFEKALHPRKFRVDGGKYHTTALTVNVFILCHSSFFCLSLSEPVSPFVSSLSQMEMWA